MSGTSTPTVPARLRDARILIVDDQELNLRLLRSVLERAGLHAITVTTDPRAVAGLVDGGAPHLVVVDLHMPGLDGFGVMEELRPRLERAGYLPVVNLTADITDEARRRALASGASDFLTKPIDPIEVVLRVRNLLETRMLYLELQVRNRDLEERVRERTAEVEAAHLETLEQLARTAEYRDDQTGRHVVRVGRTAARIAARIGLDDETVRLLRLAAPLHDLGKIAIPDRILLAERRLDSTELEEMRLHTSIGAQILSGSSAPLLELAEGIAYTHHERWDGRGYHGLVGTEIPLGARIVGIADVFDALTHERPYKPAWGLGRAVEEIVTSRERSFDPELVDAFLDLDPATLVEPSEPLPDLASWGRRQPLAPPL